MKMLLIICPDFRRSEIRTLITKHDVHAYSELMDVTGEGVTGKRMGTRVWPEKSILIFTVVPEDKKDALLSGLKDFTTRLYPGEGLRAFVLPVAEAV
jgi:hypothetical protein